MKMKLILAAAAAFVMAGCAAPTENIPYSDQLVVNAYLIGGQPIDSVYIQRTGRVTELYTNETSAVTNAMVIITGNNFSDTLIHDPLVRGHYRSLHRENVIRTGASYSITVRVSGYGDVTGTTTVPDTFTVTNSAAFPASAAYAPGTVPFRIAWSPSGHYADYLVVVRSVDLTSPEIPKSFTNDEKPDRTGIGFFLQDANSSEISWLYFNYYGKTVISVIAVDQNYFDFMKQAMAAQGASDIREIRYNLNGAIGIFGAETVASNRIEVNIIP